MEINYTETAAIREAIRQTPEYVAWQQSVVSVGECQICGNKYSLQAHHIKAFASYPEDRFNTDNGACLCIACHNEFHRQYGKSEFTEADIYAFSDEHNGNLIRAEILEEKQLEYRLQVQQGVARAQGIANQRIAERLASGRATVQEQLRSERVARERKTRQRIIKDDTAERYESVRTRQQSERRQFAERQFAERMKQIDQLDAERKERATERRVVERQVALDRLVADQAARSASAEQAEKEQAAIIKRIITFSIVMAVVLAVWVCT